MPTPRVKHSSKGHIALIAAFVLIALLAFQLWRVTSGLRALTVQTQLNTVNIQTIGTFLGADQNPPAPVEGSSPILNTETQ